MKYIYLDQNKWILLAQGWNKGKGEVYDLVSVLKKKIANGEMNIVISMVNMMETLKRFDEKSRNNLLNFMFDLSKGYTISPLRDWVIDREVENLFLKRLGKSMDIQSQVISQGISGVVGARASLKGDIPEETKAKIISKVNSLETFKKIFSSPETALHERVVSSNLAKETNKFEDARKKERTIKDKGLQYKIVMARFFEDFIFLRMAKIGSTYGFPKDFIFKKGMNMDDIVGIFQELPATYSYFSLTDRRDRDLNKEIEPNDLNDIFSFTMAIAYCDIVFGEKRFTNLAKHARLDKIYNKIITSSLEEFKKAVFS